MFVYTPILDDFFYLPVVFVQYYTDLGGYKWEIPRFASDFELWLETLFFFLKLFFDLKFHVNEIYNTVEFYSLGAYHWAMKLIWKKLLIDGITILKAEETSSLFVPGTKLIIMTNIVLFSMFLYLTFTHVGTYFFRNSVTSLYITEGGIFLYAYLDEVEEEWGQIEDVVCYMMCLLLLIAWFFLYNIFFSAIIADYIGWLIVVFSIIIAGAIFIPSHVFQWMGLAFVQYIRGCGKSTLFIFEALLDFVSVSVIMIRFLVQNVRFIFIIIGFIEYSEFIQNLSQPLSHLFLPYISWNDYWNGKFNNWYWFEILFQVLTQVIMYTYYCAHFLITYIAQLSIYVLLSFWLFYFLYTTFSIPHTDKYFFFKRYALLIKD